MTKKWRKTSERIRCKKLKSGGDLPLKQNTNSHVDTIHHLKCKVKPSPHCRYDVCDAVRFTHKVVVAKFSSSVSVITGSHYHHHHFVIIAVSSLSYRHHVILITSSPSCHRHHVIAITWSPSRHHPEASPTRCQPPITQSDKQITCLWTNHQTYHPTPMNTQNQKTINNWSHWSNNPQIIIPLLSKFLTHYHFVTEQETITITSPPVLNYS